MDYGLGVSANSLELVSLVHDVKVSTQVELQQWSGSTELYSKVRAPITCRGATAWAPSSTGTGC